MKYKSGVAIIVTFQAANAETAATILMDVYDETHAKDVPKCIAAMTEIGTTGRYYATFTPDAAGEWICVMYKSGGTQNVVKAFRVATADEFGIKAVADAVQAKTDLIGASVAPASEYDTEMARVTANVATEAKQDIVDTVVDAVKLKTDNLPASPAPASEYDTQLDQNLSTTESNIRGADSDTLKSLSDQMDAVSSPPMVG